MNMYGVNIREVTILDSSQIYVEEQKYKANKFILGPKIDIYMF